MHAPSPALHGPSAPVYSDACGSNIPLWTPYLASSFCVIVLLNLFHQLLHSDAFKFELPFPLFECQLILFFLLGKKKKKDASTYFSSSFLI